MRKVIFRSVGKTETIMKPDYWFPKMRIIVEKTIQNYVTCSIAEKKSGLLYAAKKGSVPLDAHRTDLWTFTIYEEKLQVRISSLLMHLLNSFGFLNSTKSTTTADVIEK